MKLRLGVIGTGLAWQRLHAPVIQQLIEQYEIAAMCDKDISKAMDAAKQFGLASQDIYSDYRQMLQRSDIDVIDLLVPISENFEIAKDVLQAGKNLIAEKPFAATLQGARELIELKNKNKLTVMVAENARYDEGNAMIKEMLDSGSIGEIAYFVLNTGADFEKEMKKDTFASTNWRQQPVFEGGIFLDGGIHDIALMRYLFGDVQDIKALAKPHTADYCPYMNIHSLLKFDGPIIGNYSYFSIGADQKPPIGLRIFGTQGDIYLESKTCGSVVINRQNGRSEKKAFTPNQGYYQEFLNYFQGNIVSTPEKEFGDIKLIFDILKAAL